MCKFTNKLFTQKRVKARPDQSRESQENITEKGKNFPFLVWTKKREKTLHIFEMYGSWKHLNKPYKQ